MRLLVAITPHGYGHAAQVAVVLEALAARCPDLELHLHTEVPRAFLESRIPLPFTLHPGSSDFGMRMHSALHIDLEASARDYARLNAQRDRELSRLADLLELVRPDRVLSNVPWLPLRAAAEQRIPAFALCSLNWADIYEHYFSARPEARELLAAMRDDYRSARRFLAPEPHMPMPWMDNLETIGPLARIGRNRRAEIDAAFGIGGRQLLLVALGGVAGRLPVTDWPRRADRVLLVPDEWGAEREDIIPLGRLGMPFIDILASCDALIGKLGYGTVAECACNGVPMIHAPRDDWPEEPVLAAWLARVGRLARIETADLEAGRIDAALATVAGQHFEPVPATGAAMAVERLLQG